MKLNRNFLLALFVPALFIAGELQSQTLQGNPMGQPGKSDSATVSVIPLPQVEHHGIINITEVGVGIGLGDIDPDFSRRVFSINTVFNYEINKSFIAGLGTGLNFYNGGAMIPFYLSGRHYIVPDLRTTPFLSLDAGVMISLDKFSSSGFFMSPMAGVRREVNEKVILHFSLGGLVQYAPEGVRNSFVNLKAGMSFRVK